MYSEPTKIAVINPNSNSIYTENISQSLDPLRQSSQYAIHCLTLKGAPLAIVSDDDVVAVVEPLCRTIANFDSAAAGIVIACFADPGLIEARKITPRLVVGACEAAVAASHKVGRRVGLISTGDDVDADKALMASYSQDIDFLAVESLGIPTAEIPTEPSALERLTGRAVRLQQRGVDVIVLGCAGMSVYTRQLDDALSVPVIEPVTAAVQLLIERIKKEESAKNAKNQSRAIA